MDVNDFLAPTRFIDFEEPAVARFAEQAAPGAEGEIDVAVALYEAVRDRILYDPYAFDLVPDHFRASHIVRHGRGFCVPKAVVLTAVYRALGYPAKLGFADVRNHLSTKRLLDLTGTDLFIWHGYVEVLIDGRWVKCTPAFNMSLCERFGVRPLDFDGRRDSLFHPFDMSGNRHMEYVNDRGTFADLPLDDIARDFQATYPKLLAFTAERHKADFGGEAEIERAKEAEPTA